MLRRARNFVWLPLAAALVLAGCTSINPKPPTVTITGPAAGTAVRNGNPIVLNATATDAQGADVSASIAWSSDLDGALTLDAGGAVTLSPGKHTLTATATDAKAASGTATVSVVVHLATHLVSEGRSLHLLGFDGDALVEVGSASIPATGLLPEHQIFNVIAHPSRPWLYTASMNTCSSGVTACWGNGRLDRFVLDGDTILHDGAAFLYDLSQTAVDCVQDPADPAYVGQVGYCAPIGMAFSSDASRLYVDEDDYDVLQIFSVDAAGDLTFLWEGADTSAHGLTIDSTDRYVYNGSRTFDVTGDVAVKLFDGIPGNATSIVDLPAGAGLLTTSDTSTVAVHDLANPAAPALVHDLNVGSDQARDLAFVPSLERILTLGANAVHSLSFDGATLTLDDTYVPAEAGTTQYRGVELASGGSRAVTAWFTNTSGVRAGGADLFSVAPDGSLDRLDRVTFDEETRVMFTLP